MSNTTSKRLIEQFTTFYLVINEFPIELSDLSYEAAAAAHQEIFSTFEDGVFKAPEVFQAAHDGSMEYAMPRFSLCQPEGMEERDGLAAWQIALHSDDRLDASVLSAVKRVILECSDLVAKSHGVTVRLHGVSVQSVYQFAEEVDLDVDLLAEPSAEQHSAG